MIAFIDEETGRRYSTPSHTVDSEGNIIINHTFRFNDQQSIGLFYQKRLFFLSDVDTINITLPDNEIFFLYDTEAIKDTTTTLENIKKFSLTLHGEKIDNKNFYLYCVNVGCTSSTVGEFTEQIAIGHNFYNISADFYGQREELEILLNNQGLNIPKDIERALYDTNIHNMTTDWIVLNRKYKELLLNIMDILYKKGSYQSLISSLDWFEYGDVLKLYEFWSTPKISSLYQHELSTIYTDSLKELISMYRKTTFVAIALSINKIKEGEDGVIYTENEDGEKMVPVTEDILHKWSIEDLMLKMTLLGNYFSTFFMPIHLDLLYSSVESIVFDIIKTKTYNTEVCMCTDVRELGGDVMHISASPSYTIGDVHIDRGDRIIYLSEIEPEKTFPVDKMYLGLGTIAEIDIDINNIFGRETRHYSKIITNIEGVYREYPLDLYSTVDARGNIVYPHHTIKIFIETSGNKSVGVNVVSYEGCILSGNINFDVVQPLYNEFVTKRMERLTMNEVLNKINIHNNLDFSLPSRPEKFEKNRLIYDDRCMNNISVCFIDENQSNFYICREWTGEDTDVYKSYTLEDLEALNTELIPNGWIAYTKNVDSTIVTSKSVFPEETKGTMIYLLKVNTDSTVSFTVRPTDVHVDNRKKYVVGDNRRVVYFNERRFISSLWRESVANPIASQEEAIFKCIPKTHLVCNKGGVEWRIRNITTGEEGIIKDLQEPVFWCNNTYDSEISKRGTYSITLFINGIETTHRYEFIVN